MTEIVKQSARALLFDAEQQLVLIKRTKPEQRPYWVTVGGGVEPEDTGIEAALHREVVEEIGGRIGGSARQVFLITDDHPDSESVGIQHIFVARLLSMNLDRRTGTEFTEPGRGTYEVVRIPATPDALASINLMPPELDQFARTNLHGLVALVDQAEQQRREDEAP